MSHRSLNVHRPIQTLSTSQIPPFLGRSQATRSPDFYAHRKPNPPIDSLLPMRLRVRASGSNPQFFLENRRRGVMEGQIRERRTTGALPNNAIHATRKQRRRRPGGGSQEVNDGSAATQNRSPHGSKWAEPDYLRVSGRRFGRLWVASPAAGRAHGSPSPR